MFKGNSNGNNTRPSNMSSPDKLNRIVEGTSIKGDIQGDSNIRIDGKLIGTIQTKGRVVIGKNGHVEGEVICQDADIEGSLQGKIKVEQLLSLKQTAKVSGEILTGKLAIEPGASFSGSCNMGGTRGAQSAPAAKAPEAKPQAQKAPVV